MLRRAQAQVITFEATDSVLWPALKPGLLFLAGEVQVCKDGAAFANITTLPTEIGNSGVYALSFSAAEADCGYLTYKVIKAGMQPIVRGGMTSGHPSGQVVADAGNLATTFKTNLASAVSGFWKGALLVFTEGALQHQVRKITDYNGATKFVTVDGGFTGVPADNARYILVNI